MVPKNGIYGDLAIREGPKQKQNLAKRDNRERGAKLMVRNKKNWWRREERRNKRTIWAQRVQQMDRHTPWLKAICDFVERCNPSLEFLGHKELKDELW